MAGELEESAKTTRGSPRQPGWRTGRSIRPLGTERLTRLPPKRDQERGPPWCPPREREPSGTNAKRCRVCSSRGRTASKTRCRSRRRWKRQTTSRRTATARLFSREARRLVCLATPQPLSQRVRRRKQPCSRSSCVRIVAFGSLRSWSLRSWSLFLDLAFDHGVCPFLTFASLLCSRWTWMRQTG